MQGLVYALGGSNLACSLDLHHYYYCHLQKDLFRLAVVVVAAVVAAAVVVAVVVVAVVVVAVVVAVVAAVVVVAVAVVAVAAASAIAIERSLHLGLGLRTVWVQVLVSSSHLAWS